jgi:hypothetical protein
VDDNTLFLDDFALDFLTVLSSGLRFTPVFVVGGSFRGLIGGGVSSSA